MKMALASCHARYRTMGNVGVARRAGQWGPEWRGQAVDQDETGVSGAGDCC